MKFKQTLAALALALTPVACTTITPEESETEPSTITAQQVISAFSIKVEL